MGAVRNLKVLQEAAMAGSKLKLITGFRSFLNPGDTQVTSVYSIMSVENAVPAVCPELFLYAVDSDHPLAADELVKASESRFIGVACPEHFNLTNKVYAANSALYWDQIGKARPLTEDDTFIDPDDEDGWKQVADAGILYGACTQGYFVSPVKIVKDLVPGINSDRGATDGKLKAFVNGYKDCVQYTTSMDTSRYPEGCEEVTLGSTSVRITLQISVTAETLDASGKNRKYTVTAFVKRITDGTEADIPDLPENMFLMVKSDNTSTTVERLDDSVYLRVVDPTDIQNTNPTAFGAAELAWGNDSQTVVNGCLAPATALSGAAITTLQDAVSAVSPRDTGNNSGYYKSRVYRSVRLAPKEADDDRKLIKSAVNAFVTKYEAQRKAAIGTGYDYWEAGDIS